MDQSQECHMLAKFDANRWASLALVQLVLIAGCSMAAQAQGERQPNVVLVMMDDLGYGDLGSYGGSDARTPNIDRLAREGVRLTDAYANGPVCTPTRAALISGLYPQRVKLEGVLTTSAADRELGLPALGGSLPALLKSSGYTTGLVGKWHLGWKPEFGPVAHGFDEFYGFLSGAHSYYTNQADIRGAGPGLPDLFENTTPVPATGYLTDEITRRAVSFITRHADKPFFLEVAYNAVHWPFEPPDSPPATSSQGKAPLRQMPEDSAAATRTDYVRMLERADQGIGEILAALDQRGVASNTLVIFTNDNGGEWLSRNAPLFHRKATLWEGGIRVPLIMRWPGKLPRGAISKQVAMTVDITASILSAAGARPPVSYRPDGIDIFPILRGASPERERSLFWRWVTPNRQQRAVRHGQWKLLMDGTHLLLFDVAVDPGERTDLAARHPDIVARLQRLVVDWEADVEKVRGP
jgi:arylsulfatase A-like enzyme